MSVSGGGRKPASPVGRFGPVLPDLVQFARGFCMGAADTVPGVSGGTVALILGHYQRLVTAVSRVDRVFLALAWDGRWRSAARYVDFRFLVVLGCGLLTGVALLAGVMHWLMDHRFAETMAVFFGLILASAVVVRREVRRWSTSRWVGLVAGAAGALAISLLPASGESDSWWFLYLAGSIAICAMILPGISGAFILLLLGAYHPVTGIIRDLMRGDGSAASILSLVAFGAGCLTGLLAFSKLLWWLLTRHRETTMATLLGLMVGSAAKLWPLQVPTAETATMEMKFRRYVPVSPADWEGSLVTLVALALAAAAVVLVAERIATGVAIQGDAVTDGNVGRERL